MTPDTNHVSPWHTMAKFIAPPRFFFYLQLPPQFHSEWIEYTVIIQLFASILVRHRLAWYPVTRPVSLAFASGSFVFGCFGWVVSAGDADSLLVRVLVLLRANLVDGLVDEEGAVLLGGWRAAGDDGVDVVGASIGVVGNGSPPAVVSRAAEALESTKLVDVDHTRVFALNGTDGVGRHRA